MPIQALVEPFALKDCALAAISTGKKARNLIELRDQMLSIHPGSVYYHFWGTRLNIGFENPEFPNDFAEWAAGSLHDKRLAERLGGIDPAEYATMDELREEIVETIDKRLDESEMLLWMRPERPFHFLRSQTVIFDTHHRAETPEQLAALLPDVSVGSLFFHFIDGRRRSEEGVDDFRAWIREFGDPYEPLVQRIAEVNPYFSSLSDLRDQLTQAFNRYFSGRSS